MPDRYRGYEVRLELRRRGTRELQPVRCARDIYHFMAGLECESAEHLYELLFDTKQYVHGVYLVSKGGLNNCHIDPAEVFKAALVTNSPAFALVHNHPSGVPEPSPDDVAITWRIAQGAELLNLTLLDSVIVGDGRYYSFREAGMMPTGNAR